MPKRVIIHIDESGPFDEGLTGGQSSLVGGVCSNHCSADWDRIHRAHLSTWNTSHTIKFGYPSHYHCGPLLACKLPAPVLASARDLRRFTEDVLENVASHALFAFASKNRGKRFEYSPQATYVMNLVAALRCAFEHLAADNAADIGHIEVVVAQRTIDETAKAPSGGRYMTSLLSYVADQLLVGDGPGVALARRLVGERCLALASGIGDRDAGLIAADFVCCLSRQKVKASSGTMHFCQPNEEMLLGDYRRFHDRLVAELLQSRYYGSCLESLCRLFPLTHGIPDISCLLNQFFSEKDQATLEREIPAMLAVVHQLAKHRTEAPNMLSVATSVAERLAEVAELRASEEDDDVPQTVWLHLELQALAELAACYNHTGAVGKQKEVETKLTALLARHKASAGLDALARHTFIQDVRNRNINFLFNDFRFDDAYSLADELVAARRAMVGEGEPDEILGQMLGNLGQACAFMGRQDASWNAPALDMFEESLQHFARGSHQTQMSRNFIVTCLWQDGKCLQAARRLPELPGWHLAEGDELASISDRLLLVGSQQRAFDVVNCLRLAATWVHTGAPVEPLTTALQLLEVIASRAGADHPYEQWWKWLGVLHLNAGNDVAAARCFAAATAICNRHAFTMKAIGLSVSLLAVVAAAMAGNHTLMNSLLQDYRKTLTALRIESSGYDAYMSSCVSQRSLEDVAVDARPRSEGFWLLCTHLPFAYA